MKSLVADFGVFGGRGCEADDRVIYLLVNVNFCANKMIFGSIIYEIL